MSWKSIQTCIKSMLERESTEKYVEKVGKLEKCVEITEKMEWYFKNWEDTKILKRPEN